jgi:hypothetical protein
MAPDQLREQSAAPNPSIVASRRRFTKAGIVASGVMLTLASRPVMGTGNHATKCCKGPSGWQSANMSAPGQKPVCQGRSPTYWKGCKDRWPVNGESEVKQHFNCSSYKGQRYSGISLYELCTLDFDSRRFRSDYEYQSFKYSFNYDELRLCSYIVAAYLNAKSGWTPFLKEETIRAMFTECINSDGFSPTAGVRWSVSECIEYLQATQMDAI